MNVSKENTHHQVKKFSGRCKCKRFLLFSSSLKTIHCHEVLPTEVIKLKRLRLESEWKLTKRKSLGTNIRTKYRNQARKH